MKKGLTVPNFNDTAAILISFLWKDIMGCPGAMRQNRNQDYRRIVEVVYLELYDAKWIFFHTKLKCIQRNKNRYKTNKWEYCKQEGRKVVQEYIPAGQIITKQEN